MQKKMKGIGLYVAMLVLLTILAVVMFTWTPQQTETYTYSQIVNYFKQEQVEKYSIDFNTGYLTMQVSGKETPIVYELASITYFREDIAPYLEKYEAEHPEDVFPTEYIPAEPTPVWVSLLPTLILAVLMFGGYFMIMRQANGGGKMNSFGKAKARPKDDVLRTGLVDLQRRHGEREDARGAVFQLGRHVVLEGHVQTRQRSKRLVDAHRTDDVHRRRHVAPGGRVLNEAKVAASHGLDPRTVGVVGPDAEDALVAVREGDALEVVAQPGHHR